MALRNMFPARPAGQRWAICRQIIHHLTKWRKGESVQYALATEQLGEAILMLNEALRLLDPSLTIPGTMPEPRHKTVVEQRSQALGHYDKGDYCWAGKSLVAVVRQRELLPWKSDKEILEFFYQAIELCLLAREDFPMRPDYRDLTSQVIKLFELTSTDVTVYSPD